MTTIYLAGGFYQKYKEFPEFVLKEPEFVLLDPETMPGEPYPGSYVHRDLAAIEMSDLVLAYRSSYPYVYGMAAEVGYAVRAGKPVIYVDVNPRIDSFLSGLARATFTDLAVACSFIRERYAPGGKNASKE